jgi:phosphate ABC transporter permease subunit PstA
LGEEAQAAFFLLAGVPSIICGVFIYSLIVATRIFFDQSFSAIAGGIALSVLMLPTVIKTTYEGLLLVPQELRWGAYGVGASRFVTITRITLPAAFTPIATGVVLGIARAAGETAPLIFTALFSPFWPEGLFNPIATMSVLIFNFAIMPYEAQNELAWAASFVLVIMILGANLLARALVLGKGALQPLPRERRIQAQRRLPDPQQQVRPCVKFGGGQPLGCPQQMSNALRAQQRRSRRKQGFGGLRVAA